MNDLRDAQIGDYICLGYDYSVEITEKYNDKCMMITLGNYKYPIDVENGTITFDIARFQKHESKFIYDETGHILFSCDIGISNFIEELNKKQGIKTLSSCQGNWDKSNLLSDYPYVEVGTEDDLLDLLQMLQDDDLQCLVHYNNKIYIYRGMLKNEKDIVEDIKYVEV